MHSVIYFVICGNKVGVNLLTFYLKDINISWLHEFYYSYLGNNSYKSMETR